VGTEHLLLGLMREEKGIAAQVLAGMGMTTSGVRDEVLRLLGGGPVKETTRTATEARRERQARVERQAAITLVVEHPDGRIEAKKFQRSSEAVNFLKELEY
jgi:ATP-dependent Clp protease ATP-binding subunit ClpA